MGFFDSEENFTFIVLVNDEGQYSLWPKVKEIPAGWRADGFEGSKDDCMRHVDEVWTDMRPLSLQKKMAEAQS